MLCQLLLKLLYYITETTLLLLFLLHTHTHTHAHTDHQQAAVHPKNNFSDEDNEALADIYCNEDASFAYKLNQLNSLELTERSRIRVIFRNQTPNTLWMSWSDCDGNLHHLRQLKPCTTIVTGVSNGLQTREDNVHMESTVLGDAFVVATRSCTSDKVDIEMDSIKATPDKSDTSTETKRKEEFVSKEYVVNPDSSTDAEQNTDIPKPTFERSDDTSSSSENQIASDETKEKDDCIVNENPHNISDAESKIDSSKPAIERSTSSSSSSSSKNPIASTESEEKDDCISKEMVIDPDSIIAGYRPRKLFLPNNGLKKVKYDEGLCVHIVTITRQSPSQRRTVLELDQEAMASAIRWQYQLTTCASVIDNEPLDTSNKDYTDMKIGGWPIKCEKGLFCEAIVEEDENSSYQTLLKVRKQMDIDLKAAMLKLPPNAVNLLKKSTPIYINKSQDYGPKCIPVKGRGMCFHPDYQWLKENGMATAKCGCIELFQACEYLDGNHLWHGKGGVMIHELAHAWHNKFLENGYSNEEIERCYKLAMEEKLYDSVKVHLMDGTRKRRAYACTNAMEYFAELSVAFLGGVGDDENLEFNKWYPFNRKELKEHDPRAYEMLKEMWNVEDDT